jgi:tRNA(Ile)-lysidine synthase
MDASFSSGRYVLAVSGGVDSVVLLDMLSKFPDLELIIAHFDHGIREDSCKDAELVERHAALYGYTFVLDSAQLGISASEATARNARYSFLRTVKNKYNAKAIITAHHQDDVLETMIINIFRGTDRKGLTSLKTNKQLIRPLLSLTKNQLLQYAKTHNLEWREDSTNQESAYLRNYIRHHVLSKLSNEKRKELLAIHKTVSMLNSKINQEIASLLQSDTHVNRSWLLSFSNQVACELVAEMLRRNDIAISKRLVQKVVIACKTARPGKIIDVGGGAQIVVLDQYNEALWIKNHFRRNQVDQTVGRTPRI